MILGYTGPKTGMTPAAAATVARLFRDLPLHVLHHGDCVGGDREAHELAVAIGAYIVTHPPDDDVLRAFCRADEEREPKGYLKRDVDIAREGRDGLVAALESKVELFRGSGTWSTVRRARRARRRIWKVWVDGTFEIEEPES